jgi:MraZ protein
MLITGTHELTIDPKNRLSVPASIRARLEAESHSNVFYLVPGVWGGSLNLYPEKCFEAHVEERHGSLEPGEDKDILEAVFLAQATTLEMDKQGRLVLPQRMLDQAKVGKRAMLAGFRDHMILWDRLAYDAFMKEHSPRYKDLLERARLKTRLKQSNGAGA